MRRRDERRGAAEWAARERAPWPPEQAPGQPGASGKALHGADGDGLSDLVRGLVVQGAAASKVAVLLGWYLWTLPFRFGCKVVVWLFIRLVARPVDTVQDKVLGKRELELERIVRSISAAVKPLWYRLFPFNVPAEESRQQPQVQFAGPTPSAPAAPPGLAFAEGAATAAAQDLDNDLPGSDDFGSDDYGSEDRFPAARDRRRHGHARHGRRGRGAGAGEEDSYGSYDSSPSARLPKSTEGMSSADLDKAVMLAIEAKQTHQVVEKLFWIAVMLMAIIGIVLVRIDFTRKWGGHKVGNADPALGFEGVYGVLVVLTIAFRSDFPFNLGVLMLVVFFAGVVFGTIIARSAFAVRNS